MGIYGRTAVAMIGSHILAFMKRELVGLDFEGLSGGFEERIRNNLTEETKNTYKGLSRARLMYCG